MPGIIAPPGYPEELTRFAKMLKMGVPEAAVRGKMATEGYDDDMYDKYMNPDTAITLNQQQASQSEENEEHQNEEKKEEIDLLDPNQPDTSPTVNNNIQSNNDKKVSSGFFSSQNFVPEPDSELNMDILQPVPVKKTLLIVNTFVVNTAAFLNKFVSTCESKLHKIHTDIQRMETTMLLLESKLSSIDWLREAEQGKAPIIPSVESWETTEFKDSATENNNKRSNSNDSGSGESKEEKIDSSEQPPPEPEKPAEDPLLSDPEMKGWFKMLKFGVPAPAVRGKMSRSGIEDDVIERVIQLHNER